MLYLVIFSIFALYYAKEQHLILLAKSIYKLFQNLSIIKMNVQFKGSFPKESQCPTEMMPEYAFIGRSNVGKSSLINMLCQQKSLAKVSATPGKTQMINFFEVDKVWNLVDLPGYGYAKISKKHRSSLKKMMSVYFEKRQQLMCTFVLIDANVPPQKIDIEFINQFGEWGLPFVIVFTKTDRLKPKQLGENIAKIEEALLEHWSELPQRFYTSSTKGEGREPILNFIHSINDEYEQQA